MLILFISLLTLTYAKNCTDTSHFSPLQILQSGKGPNDLGDYDQCIRDEHSRYLLAKISGDDNEYRLGLCVPDDCTDADMEYAVKSILNPKYQALKDLGLTSKALDIQVSEVPQEKLGFSGYLCLIIFATLIILTIVGTILEKNAENKQKESIPAVELVQSEISDEIPIPSAQQSLIQPSSPKKNEDMSFIHHFSLFRNGAKFVEQTKGGPMSCINGLRVLAMLWLISGNVYCILYESFKSNPWEVHVTSEKAFSSLLYSSGYAIDTFFFLSAFLLAYQMFSALTSAGGSLGPSGWGMIYAQRILRLLPIYILWIFFLVSVFPTLGHGPVWDSIGKPVTDCYDYWWTNILFMNNLIPGGAGNSCFGIGWYLANDSQFFIISPIIILIYYKCSKYFSWLLFFTLIGISVIISTSVADAKHLLVTDITSEDAQHSLFDKPYCRMPPFLFGLLSSAIYFSHVKKNSDDKAARTLRRVLRGIGGYLSMTVGVVLGIVAIVVQIDFWAEGSTKSQLDNAFFLGFNRLVWGLALMLFILPLLLGKLRWLRNILSASCFAIMAKLTFCLFLVQIMVIIYSVSMARQSFHWSQFTIFKETIVMIVVTYFFAFVLYFLVEAPYASLTKNFGAREKEESSK